jgi:hypothetical protein
MFKSFPFSNYLTIWPFPEWYFPTRYWQMWKPKNSNPGWSPSKV